MGMDILLIFNCETHYGLQLIVKTCIEVYSYCTCIQEISPSCKKIVTRSAVPFWISLELFEPKQSLSNSCHDQSLKSIIL
jgi:uncharacterized membrane protein